MSRPARFAALAVVVTLAAGCAGADDPTPDPTTTAGTEPSPDPTTTADTDLEAAVTIPDTPVGEQAQWVLDALAAADGPSADDATARFAPVFLDQVPADEMATVFGQLRGFGPFEVTGYQGVELTAQATVRNGSGDPMTLDVAVDDSGLITGMLLRPATEPPEIGSWPDVDDAYADAPGARVFAADVIDGTCEPVHEFGDPTEPAPLGSTFKLYVLGAVQQAVLDGEVAWDDTVTVTAESRVPSSVETDKLDDGTELSVADAARHMIAVSDNTATDLLIGVVGRDAVEQAVVDLGTEDPARLRPFLTTRELFQLGWTDPALRDDWAGADEAGRRVILDTLPGGPLDFDPAAAVDPVHPYGLDWFASGVDICAAHVELQELAAADDTDTVRDLLAVNPGIELDTDTWPYVAYKGGSAPGELSGSWYVENADGHGQVLVVQFAGEDPAALSDLGYLFGVAGNAFTLFTK